MARIALVYGRDETLFVCLFVYFSVFKRTLRSFHSTSLILHVSRLFTYSQNGSGDPARELEAKASTKVALKKVGSKDSGLGEVSLSDAQHTA